MRKMYFKDNIATVQLEFTIEMIIIIIMIK